MHTRDRRHKCVNNRAQITYLFLYKFRNFRTHPVVSFFFDNRFTFAQLKILVAKINQSNRCVFFAHIR